MDSKSWIIPGSGRWLIIFTIALLAVSAVPALAVEPSEMASPSDSPEAGFQGLPDAEDVRQGIEMAEAEEAKRQRWLESAEAVRQREESRSLFADLSATETRTLLTTVFADQLAKLNDDPARWLSDAGIAQPLGESVAAVRKEGDTSLLDAGMPVRATDEDGELRKVDLSLDQVQDGFVPVNPLAEVVIPEGAAEPIEVGKHGLAISAVGADASRSGQLLGDKNVFYPETQGSDSDRVVAVTSDGIEIFDLLRSVESPEAMRYEIEMPEDAELRSDGNGGAEVASGERILAWIPFPVAFDAQGTQVPVTLEIEGNMIELSISHREADVAYPILLDPHVHVLEESVNYNWFNGGPTQGLDSGAWVFYKNPTNASWIEGSTWCLNYCWGARGLYTRIKGGAHWGGEFGHWTYAAPTPTSYLVNAWIIPFWRQDHSCSKSQYPQPHDYVGMWDNLNQTWKQPPRIDQAISVGSVDLQHAGDTLIFGLGTGPGSIDPCARELGAGGVAIWLDDSQNPSMNSVSGIPSGWIGDTPQFTINANASDPGLGIWEMTLSPVGRPPMEHKLTCTGVSYNRCPTSWSEPFVVSGASFDEGVRGVQFSAKDVTKKVSNTLQAQTKVDLTPPEVTLDGQLAIITEEDGDEEPPPSSTEAERLRLPVYNLKVEAEDGSNAEDKTKRSGVKDIEVFLDGEEQQVPWGPNPTPCDSCPMTQSYQLRLTDLASAGKHTLEIKVKDQVGHVRPRNIEFEYFPATGIKDEYAMHYFPLPDGQGNEAEEEHPARPELAVNVMNGNLVYRERDIDIENYGFDLELERIYNSQLPDSENTEWGDGWTLAQTPKLEVQSPSKATMLGTSGALEGKVGLPAGAGETTFDPELRALVTKTPLGAYTLTDESGETNTSLAFGSNGRPKTLLTEGSARIDYAYEEGVLSEVAVDDPATAAYPSGEPPAPAPDPVPSYASSFGAYGTGNGQFNQPADVAVGPDGDLWVADADNDRVQHFDSSGNYIGKFGSNGTGNGQFRRPVAIEIDEDGYIWVLDSMNERLQKFNDQGQYLSKWGSFGTASGKLDTPKGFAIDADGNFWIADTANDRIQRFTATGGFLKVAGTSGPGDLSEPMGIDVGPEGEVFVADWEQNRVVVFDTNGEYEAAFGTEGYGDGQFRGPVAVEIDSQGNVWVSDEKNERIEQFDLTGQYVAQFGTEGSGDGEMELTNPMGITTDSEGGIWVTDSGNDRLQLWRLDGYRPTYATSFGSSGEGDGEFEQPADLAIGPEGDLWVVDADNDRVQHFDSNGNFMDQFGSFGTANGQFRHPVAIEIDADGDLWVLDSFNERLQEFDEDGNFLTKWGSFGTSDGKLDTPEGFAIDAEGNFWVSDTANQRIQKFTKAGAFLKVAGTSGPGDLTEPLGIDVGPEGEVFVADWEQDRVVVFNAAGEYEAAFGTEGYGDGQFRGPVAVEIDSQGNVWVSDEKNERVEQFDTQGAFITHFGSEGSDEGEMELTSPMGITTDSEGGIWVTDSGNDRVQLWQALNPPPSDEELLNDDPALQLDTYEGNFIGSVAGAGVGKHSYEHDGDSLITHEGPQEAAAYEYDGAGRLTNVTISNGTWASIVYDPTYGRVSEVTVDPAGEAPEKTTEFNYSDDPRRTVVIPPDAPHITYEIGGDGSVLKWWNALEPPVFDKLSGSLIAERETSTPILAGAHNLEIQAHSEEGIASIQVIANGNQLVDESTCDKPEIIECKTQLNEWVTETGLHPPGVLPLEVIATDRLGQTMGERFWVNIPSTPPEPPGELTPPKFNDILKFREDYGLEVVFPVKNELELNDRIFDLMGAWHNPQTPDGEVARASMDRWGVPLRPADVAELEFREHYLANNAPIISQWGEDQAASTYAGYHIDHPAGGKIRIGFTANQAGRVQELQQLSGLIAADRLASFTTQPSRSQAHLSSISQSFDQQVAANPEIQSLLTSGEFDVRSNKVRIGTKNVAAVNSFLQSIFGSNSGIEAFNDPDPPTHRVEIDEGARARKLSSHHLFAGDFIRLGFEIGRCTLGFGAWEESSNTQADGSPLLAHFALTAGHCYYKDQRPKRGGYKINKDGEVEEGQTGPLGTVRRNSTGLAHSGFETEAAAIRLNETTSVPRAIFKSSNASQLINGSMAWIPGMTLCHSGVYGGVYCGPTKPKLRKTYWNGPEGLVTWEIVEEAYSECGDSGSPVWDPKTGKAVGILNGGPGCATGPTWLIPLVSLEGRPELPEVIPGTAPGALNAPDMAPLYIVGG
jgi:YD repeat-containing protein